MGKSIFHTGRLGAGHAMKTINNYIAALNLVSAVRNQYPRVEIGSSGATGFGGRMIVGGSVNVGGLSTNCSERRKLKGKFGLFASVRTA